MLLNSLYLTLIPLVATIAYSLPLDAAPKARNLTPRAKSYSVVNVDGGSSTHAPSEETTVVEATKTKTVKVTDTAPAKTDTVTVEPTPAPAPQSTSTSTTTSPSETPSPSKPENSSGKPTGTPKPSIVTIIITETTGPTEYYDNGMWHTSYAVKTFEAAATDLASPISTPFPTPQASAAISYNQTLARRY